MKTLRIMTLGLLVASCIQLPLLLAVEPDSFRYADRLLSIEDAGPPALFEDSVIFTAANGARRVGIAFAHEDFSRVHWFKRLYKPLATLAEAEPLPRMAEGGMLRYDSGVLFYVYEWPLELSSLEYRMVIDGVWTPDPWNPDTVYRQTNGQSLSRLSLSTMVRDDKDGASLVRALPPRARDHGPVFNGGRVDFYLETGVRGETISLAGSFNAWDPFMYEMTETSPGVYHIGLTLPPGVHHYLFYRNSVAVLDETNPDKVYSEEGRAVSRLVIPARVAYN